MNKSARWRLIFQPENYRLHKIQLELIWAAQPTLCTSRRCNVKTVVGLHLQRTKWAEKRTEQKEKKTSKKKTQIKQNMNLRSTVVPTNLYILK